MTHEIDRMFARARELQEGGKCFSEATSIASLEHRIEKWGSPANKFDGYLDVRVYGDFRAPEAELSLPELGITIDPTPVEEKTVFPALCVLKARLRLKSNRWKQSATHRVG